jgi:death-on-curing protein
MRPELRYLTINEVLLLHRRIIEQTGGATGLRDRGALESAIAQPQMMFSGHDLYGSLPEKAGALGFSLAMNHPFVDGNKRVAHGAMELFLVLNGMEIGCAIDEQEAVMLALASGSLGREQFVDWLGSHLKPLEFC